MYSEVVGDDGEGTPVVYVPGLDGSGEMLHGTGDRISGVARLLRVRYVEDSNRPGGAAIYDRLADTIADALHDRDLERVTLLAESFGGGVALTLALRHPELVGRMVLVNTFCWYPQRVRIRLGTWSAAVTPAWLLARGRRWFAARLFYRPRRDDESERRFHATLAGFTRPGYVRRLVAIRHLDLRSRLGDVRVPVELYASDRDRVLPSPRTMRVLADGLPDARLHTIENANHIVLPLREEPWVERVLGTAR